ncbi:MAG: GatB/YqeY domain-containing protein [Deltaproteobacteria bacterium]|jgi:uncharacterized protein|nr:GatB/YqeY domain-containing protein [Deltaproteobacteria bacterium]
MKFKDKIGDELKGAMKARDTGAVAGLRMILAAIQNREIEKRGDLDDDECVRVLSTLAKQRNESIDMYKKGGRDDLVQREAAELALIKSFLPAELSSDELARIVDDAIAESGASGPGDMGKVMKIVTPKTRGRADGKAVSELVKTKLS